MSSDAGKRISFCTLGCKLNYAETVTLGREFLAQGYRIVDFRERSDVVLINSCSVTENADRECRKIVRQALRRSPDAYVIVTGCYAQLRPGEIAAIAGVDLVLGTKEKFAIAEFADGFQKQGIPSVHVSCVDEIDAFGPAFSDEAGGRTRAFLKVQDGCDYNCSFCTIPLARGASRSQEMGETLRQARTIIAGGFHEIVLSGVNVGDYGSRGGESFVALLRSLLALEGDFRLRISSIEPNLLTDEIIDLAAASEKMCRHFHVPLQSGSAEVLRLMRRRYNRALYRERIARIRSAIPEACVGIDVIVGHPGETEEMFLETYRFLEELPFSYLHVFSYSERPDTQALSLPGKVPQGERGKRSRMLRDLSVRQRRKFYESQRGKVLRVLFESEEEKGHITGFSDNYVRVGVPFSPELVNRVARVSIGEAEEGFMSGTLTPENAADAKSAL